ncbi:MAG: hypothetical protein AAGA34_03915 [Pseudomonadota bacterium]
MHYFRAYGQLVESELPLPEFQSVSPGEIGSGVQPDLRIVLRSLPGVPLEERNAGGFRVRDGVVDFEVADTVRIRVPNSERIEVDLLDGKRVREARLFVTGSAFGAWVFQSGRIPFHCGMVTQSGRGLAITGPSGVGKSTLTTALVDRGFGFMSDDVVVFDTIEGGAVRITPSFPRIKLWQDAADHLAIETAGLSRLHQDLEKFHVPFSADRVVESAALSAVFRLRFDEAYEGVQCRRLAIPEAMLVLRENIYRPALVPALGLETTAFNLIATILQNVPVFDLSRPQNFDGFEATIEAIEEAVGELGVEV